MGYLALNGLPLRWVDLTRSFLEHIRGRALQEAHLLYKVYRNLTVPFDQLLWGDELECLVVREDSSTRLVLADENARLLEATTTRISLMPEFARFVIEMIPRKPYSQDLASVDSLLETKRSELMELYALATNFGLDILLGVTHPLFGTQYIREGRCNVDPLGLHAKLLHHTTDHPRFQALSKNIMARRRALPWIPIRTRDGLRFLPGVLHGMGLCGLQVTLQAPNELISRLLYDSLQPLAPLFLALTACTPVLAGHSLETDTRFGIIAASVDDRTSREEHLRSRYDASQLYLLGQDVELPTGQEYDEYATNYFRHVVSREPLVLYPEDGDSADNCQSYWQTYSSFTWETCRWKPPSRPEDGWRIEFRPMEMQCSVAENTAFSAFICLLGRAIISFGLDFRVPHALIRTSLEDAERRGAIRTDIFWARDVPLFHSYIHSEIPQNFRLAFVERFRPILSHAIASRPNDNVPQIIRVSASEYMLGSDRYVGLIPIVQLYVELEGQGRRYRFIEECLSFLAKRASGVLRTCAEQTRCIIEQSKSFSEGIDNIVVFMRKIRDMSLQEVSDYYR
ncbi:Glutamate-cysteine ligase [Giardia muris]|uniref:Glutamate--cysteine ligase n=1 Tax=Giardia muris TaxID=5742 RepID=A0A3S7RNF7_GIAMU|nr:Glutamate-cysteine ligase [Giardia muris]TNJ26485.1 Glutamate-cysteine ligase [Giardia muris]|eukprot:TNJ26485.1 Glutamate-cysteine ligase [Giardia muris]